MWMVMNERQPEIVRRALTIGRYSEIEVSERTFERRKVEFEHWHETFSLWAMIES